MKQIYTRSFWFANLLIIFLASACKEDPHPIPNVPVNIVINTDLPTYQPLKVTGGWAYTEGGSRGIVVYNNFNTFVALDRHSTYNSDDPCAQVSLNPDNPFELIDTCSGSVFSILSGVVIEGPAEFPLRSYRTQWDGSYSISIYN